MTTTRVVERRYVVNVTERSGHCRDATFIQQTLRQEHVTLGVVCNGTLRTSPPRRQVRPGRTERHVKKRPRCQRTSTRYSRFVSDPWVKVKNATSQRRLGVSGHVKLRHQRNVEERHKGDVLVVRSTDAASADFTLLTAVTL